MNARTLSGSNGHLSMAILYMSKEQGKQCWGSYSETVVWQATSYS